MFFLGLVRTNKETGAVEKTNDMDYEDYMNIIHRYNSIFDIVNQPIAPDKAYNIFINLLSLSSLIS